MNRATTLTTAACMLLLAGCASTTTTTTSSDAQPSTSVTVGSTLKASAGPATPSPATPKMTTAAWYKANGSMIGTLQSDVASVTADQRDNGSLSTDCLGLDNDWTVAHGLPPIPNAAAQNAWSSALQTLRKGWWDCNGGESDSKQSEIDNAVAEIQSGGALLTRTKHLITG